MITEAQVHDAADMLNQVGRKPTFAAIREYLGNYGSFSTISKALATWSPPSDAPRDAGPPPTAITQRGDALVADIWAYARADAEGDMQKFREEADARIAQAEADREQMATTADALAAERDTLRIDLAQRDAVIAEAGVAAEKATIELVACRSEVRALRMALTQLGAEIGVRVRTKAQPKKASVKADTVATKAA